MNVVVKLNFDECLKIADDYTWAEIVDIAKKQGFSDIEVKGPNKLYAIMTLKQNGGRIGFKNTKNNSRFYQI
jgi:hypothetical protein